MVWILQSRSWATARPRRRQLRDPVCVVGGDVLALVVVGLESLTDRQAGHVVIGVVHN